MKKFQYQLLLLDNPGGLEGTAGYEELTTRLNDIGCQGWEILSITETTYPREGKRGLLAMLKRELPAG